MEVWISLSKHSSHNHSLGLLLLPLMCCFHAKSSKSSLSRAWVWILERLGTPSFHSEMEFSWVWEETLGEYEHARHGTVALLTEITRGRFLLFLCTVSAFITSTSKTNSPLQIFSQHLFRIRFSQSLTWFCLVQNQVRQIDTWRNSHVWPHSVMYLCLIRLPFVIFEGSKSGVTFYSFEKVGCWKVEVSHISWFCEVWIGVSRLLCHGFRLSPSGCKVPHQCSTHFPWF